jgi:Na+/melibiose symporter-like transporter
MHDEIPVITRPLFEDLGDSEDAQVELFVAAVIVGVISIAALAVHFAADWHETALRQAVSETRIQATAKANLHTQILLADAYRKGYATGQLYQCAHASN